MAAGGNRVHQELKQAWDWRMEEGRFEGTQALRVFHGPGEGSGELGEIALDYFDGHFWMTEWGAISQTTRDQVSKFLSSIAAKSAVYLTRPEKGIPDGPKVLLGNPLTEPFVVQEGPAKFWIRLLGTRHPGLFLDHQPLREWLRSNSRGLRVLNTFAYTGSLSVACGLGGASHVTTLDLSKPTIRWAEDNWKLNGLSDQQSRFIYGDVFEWFPRLKKQGLIYDLVILDPPSFSRGNKGRFSTAKDLTSLHELALDVLAPGGILVTSINSANVPRKKFEADVLKAFSSRGARSRVIREITLPDTFPDNYLKGLILKRES